MTGFPRGFGPDDLPPTGEASAPELATSLRVGRELDAFAAAERVEPPADFTTRVMDAIATEPAPRPAAVLGKALRRGRVLVLLGGLGDAWRVAFSGGRPAAARAQAFALVLVAAIGIGSIGGLVGVGASALLDRSDSAPGPSPSRPITLPSPSPTPSPTPSVSPTPTVSPWPTLSITPPTTRTPRPTATGTSKPSGTDEAKTPRPSDHSGPG